MPPPTQHGSELFSAIKKYNLLIMGIISILLFIVYFSIGDASSKINSAILGVAGSIFAALIFSLGLHASEESRNKQTEDLLTSIDNNLEGIPKAIEAYISNIFHNDISGLCKFYNIKTPTEQIEKIIHDNTKNIHFTAMGINLHHFRALLNFISHKNDAIIHLLLPDPNSDSLANLCAREGRVLKNVQDEIHLITNMLDTEATKANVSVRWTSNPSSITIVRIGNIIFWRPRLHNELSRDEHFCLEINYNTSPLFFRIMKRELGSSWDDAKTDKFSINGGSDGK